MKRNRERFPSDFVFSLTDQEHAVLRSQIVTANTRLSGRGGRRTAPYAFTEQGVAMLSSVLRSDRAVQVNVEIMRAFVRLRSLVGQNRELAQRLDALESKYDSDAGGTECVVLRESRGSRGADRRRRLHESTHRTVEFKARRRSDN